MTSSNGPLAEFELIARAASRRPLPPIQVGQGVDTNVLAAKLQAASAHADVATLPDQQRMAGTKQAIMRVARLFLPRQAAFNREVLDLVAMLGHQVTVLGATFDQRLAATSAVVTELSLKLEDGEASLSEIRSALGQLDELRRSHEQREAQASPGGTSLEALERVQDDLRSTVTSLSAAVDALLRDLRNLVPPQVEAATLAACEGLVEGARERRYSRFEDKYRGDSHDIEASLVPYLDDVLARRDLGGQLLDIGPGRGEWLRLLAKHDVAARGVDTNAEFVEHCRSEGLDVVLGDGIEHLRSVPPGSLMAVTCFHVIEHLPIAQHVELFEAALRALRPGGLVIVETPNPTNLVVGAAAFYRDPTHLRPLHPDYLLFLAQEAGFVANELRFLHPRDGYDSASGDRGALDAEVRWAILGPQDVALLGWRPGGGQPRPS